MKIFIDTNTFADAPAVYADAEKTQALPRVLPLVQGFKGQLAVGFLGGRAPSQSARAIFAARPLGSKTDVVQTEPGEIRVEGDATVIRFNITADTTQLAEALGDAESLAVRAGIVVEEEEALCRPARSEWQLTFSVSATALGGDQPDPRPSEADELRSEIAAEAACRAAADAELASELRSEIAAEAACRAAADAELASELRSEIAAESACRKSELLRVDSKFSELTDAVGELSDALGEKADAADAVLLAAADSAEKNAASKHGKAALLTVDGGAGGVYISGLDGATRADEKWIAKARHDGVRVFRAPGEAPENFGYYADSCFCAGDVIARAKNVACARADVCSSMAAQSSELRAAWTQDIRANAQALYSEISAESAKALSTEIQLRAWADERLCRSILAEREAREGFEKAAKACLNFIVNTELPGVDARIANAVGSEAACRAAADAALCARICKIEKCGASSACGLPGACVDARIEKAVTSEAACRAAADAALHESIDALDASFGASQEAQSSELRAAWTQDIRANAQALYSAISAESAKALSTEIQIRMWADESLCRRILAEREAREGFEKAAKACLNYIVNTELPGVDARIANAVGSEAACRAAADAALCARICKIEKCGASSACGLPGACVDARIEKAVTSEAACRAAADAALQANIDALDASFGEALCAQNSELRDWTDGRFVCRGGDFVVGPGARLEFADSKCATAAAMRFTDSPTGGVLSVGSASTAAAMTWMSGNYMSWFSPEFLRLYSGASVVSPTAKIEANPNGVILAAGAGDAAKIVVDAGKIQVSGAALTLNVAPTASAHAATKGYVDAADAETLDALDAESACRKSEILRVNSNLDALSCAVGELTDALDAESVAREKAVGAEAACRTAADACLRRCIGARDSAVRALCGTVASLRTCVSAINTNVACVYPQIPKICSKLTMISACAARLDSRVEALEDSGDVEAQLAAEANCRKAADAAERSCRRAADAALCSRVRALEDSTEIEVLSARVGSIDNRVLRLGDCLHDAEARIDGDIDALDARVEALEQGGGGGGGGGGGDATLAGDNVWTGRNVFVADAGQGGGFVVGASRSGSEMLRVGQGLPVRDDIPISISLRCVSIGSAATLLVHDGLPSRCGGGVRFVQSQGGFANVRIADRIVPSAHGRVMIPNPALCRSQWEAVDDAARRNAAGEVTSAVVLSSPKSVMIEFVTMSEFNAVPAACKTCHSLYFILCGDEPL